MKVGIPPTGLLQAALQHPAREAETASNAVDSGTGPIQPEFDQVRDAGRKVLADRLVLMRLEPRLAGRPYVRTLLLSCERRPFFQLIPWRAKKRDRPLVLVWTPCSASRSRTKRRGSCLEILRISAACASMRFEV